MADTDVRFVPSGSSRTTYNFGDKNSPLKGVRTEASPAGVEGTMLGIIYPDVDLRWKFAPIGSLFQDTAAKSGGPKMTGGLEFSAALTQGGKNIVSPRVAFTVGLDKKGNVVTQLSTGFRLPLTFIPKNPFLEGLTVDFTLANKSPGMGLGFYGEFDFSKIKEKATAAAKAELKKEIVKAAEDGAKPDAKDKK